jgi:hypothetical protein
MADRELTPEHAGELFGRPTQSKPEPTAEQVIAYADGKREEQRRLIESLHGDAERVPVRDPIIPSRGPDHTERPLIADEGRPPEFQPPFEEVD